MIVNIFSLPRSGTNFLANWLFWNYKINTINSGGGRYPLRRRPDLHSIYTPSGMYRKNCRNIVRDEMSFTVNGSKKNFFSHQLSSFSVRMKNNFNYVLLRDPIDTSVSMHNYYIKHLTHKNWNMEEEKNLREFVHKYTSLNNKKLQKKYNIRDILHLELVVNGDQRNVFDKLLEPATNESFFCSLGHNIKKDVNGLYCTCGAVKAQGTTSTSIELDINRYKGLTPSFDTAKLRQMLNEAKLDE